MKNLLNVGGIYLSLLVLVFLFLTSSCQKEDFSPQIVDEPEVPQVELRSGFSGPSWMNFYRGVSSNKVFYSYSYNGTNWSGDHQILSAESKYGVGAVCFNNKVYVFYRGKNSNRIFYAYTSNGTTWSGNIQLGNGAETETAPDAVVFNNRIYVYYEDPNGNMRTCSSANGTSWSSTSQLTNSGGTNWNQYDIVGTFGVTNLNGDLYMAVVSDETPAFSEYTVDVLRSTDGISWSNQNLQSSGVNTTVESYYKEGIGVDITSFNQSLQLTFVEKKSVPGDKYYSGVVSYRFIPDITDPNLPVWTQVSTTAQSRAVPSIAASKFFPQEVRIANRGDRWDDLEIASATFTGTSFSVPQTSIGSTNHSTRLLYTK